jgi:hypothetical protein
VMPNHFHSIVIIVPTHSVGADLRVCPSKINDAYTMGEHIGSPQQTGSPQRDTKINHNLSTIIQWFKTMTTNEYIRNVKTKNWTQFAGKLWQRNFYEHINRDEKELFRIRQYIRNNPLNWDSDGENPCRKSPRYVGQNGRTHRFAPTPRRAVISPGKTGRRGPGNSVLCRTGPAALSGGP